MNLSHPDINVADILVSMILQRKRITMLQARAIANLVAAETDGLIMRGDRDDTILAVLAD